MKHTPFVYRERGRTRVVCWCGFAYVSSLGYTDSDAQKAAARHVEHPEKPCGERRVVGLTQMVCIRAEHHGHSYSAPAVDDHRRRQGLTVNADRHVFVKADDAAR